jgi:hypothetical protein
LEELNSLHMPRAGGDHVIGFRRKSDGPALGQSLNRAMDNIAGVVCAAQIDDHGRHGQGPTSWMPCTRRAVLAGKTQKQAETWKNTAVCPAQSSIGIWAGRANRGESIRSGPHKNGAEPKPDSDHRTLFAL